ncbi:hypothetical protein M378DRAFT_168285, partial [Amanita muscaria Koide BX008]
PITAVGFCCHLDGRRYLYEQSQLSRWSMDVLSSDTEFTSPPEDVIFIVGLFVLAFLSDLLMIWRCWVIRTSSHLEPWDL